MTMPYIEKASPFSHDATEQALVEAFQNLNFVEENKRDATLAKDPLVNHENGSNAIKFQYPLRLYAKHCVYYLRTGKCKFGFHCKFNHPFLPLRRVTSTEAIEEKETKNERKPPDQIECKYNLTPEGCKYGKDCSYVHFKENEETGTSELNFLGLPIRLGERECPFYMRNGSCRYGSNCRFHHPDPKAMTVFSSENHSGELDSHRFIWQPHQTAAPLSPHVLPEHHVPLDHSSKMNLFPQEDHLNSKCSEYQASFMSKERPKPSLSAPAMSTSLKADIYTHNQKQTQREEFPERPGQLECVYFMKNGDCKYRSACRYHHPKNRISPLSDLTVDLGTHNKKHVRSEDFPRRPGQMECAYFKETADSKYRSACRYHHLKNSDQGRFHVLSEKGFPLRPGRKICWHYKQYGICKYGIDCYFDHPENLESSDCPASFASEPVSSNDFPSFGGTTNGWV